MMISRREFLMLAAVCGLDFTSQSHNAAAATGSATAAMGTTILPLWPDLPPGGGGPSGPPRVTVRGAVSNIATPSIEILRPQTPNGAAVLVAAGGGYKRMEMGNEAHPAAHWLAERGMTAFVLSYRLPGEGWTVGPLAPLQDAQRALRLIRARSAEFSVDPKRIGVLGFSAGGHLLGLAADRSAFRSYAAIDAADAVSARPDWAALIYPVISLKPPYDQTSTRKQLVGKHPSAAESAEWSVETHVGAHCPPMFLTQAEDDPISDPQNTVIMKAACDHAGIPCELQQLESGGHGFGMGKPGTPTEAWSGRFETWLRTVGALP
jgi:acetyl esterase/lipase